MLRFAPSPTGDMHIGDLRVALLNYIVSQQKEEDFIVRIEDMDKEKVIDGKDNEILGLLELFGIKCTQTIYQSENYKFHSAMALQLLHEKKAFSCFCSKEWIENKQREAKDASKPYSYDDACRNLPAELVIDNINPFSIRINRPDSNIVVKDKIQGDRSFTPDEVDSFVIMNQDKTPTYDFACGVDDMLSDISIVIRDEKHIANTPKQVHVRRSLGYEKEVEFAHLPVIAGDDKVTKVTWLLEQGFLPEAISNYLISTIFKAPNEIFTLHDAIGFFDINSVNNSPANFNLEELKSINQKHLKNLDAKELSRYVGFADSDIGELARVYLDKVSTTKELKAKIEPVFLQKDIPQEFKEQTQKISKAIKNAPFFDKYDDFKGYIMSESGLDDKSFTISISYVLTGAADTPDIVKIYKYLKNYIGEIVK